MSFYQIKPKCLNMMRPLINYSLAGIATLCSMFASAQKTDTLPAPYATKSSMNFSNVIGWENGQMPIAPEGFVVNKYAEGFEHPRWLYVLPNGDVLVAESNSNYNLIEKIGGTIVGASKSNNLNKSADRISIIRDTDKDGIADTKEIFLTDLAQPLGMLLLNNWLYVANTSSIYRVPYKTGDTKITIPGKKIMDLPAGKFNQHWTRNIIANANGTKIYVAIGSGTNVADKGLENEVLRANILEINPDGSGMRVYASGLRNPVGMDWAPGTNTLWTAVNERDLLGDDLVPDYLTSVKPGGFYGWPWVYWGTHFDPRVPAPPVQTRNTIVPDVDLGSHTASLGLVFYRGKSFPSKYAMAHLCLSMVRGTALRSLATR